MKLISFMTIIPFIGLLCNSNSTPTNIIKTNDSIRVDKGVIIFSKLGIDYFLSVKDTQNFTKKNYLYEKYESGFVISNLGIQKRIDLIKIFSDTLNDKFNHPFTNLVPVSIEYYLIDSAKNVVKSNVCLKLRDSIDCYSFDSNLRFLIKVTPIE